MSDESKTKLGAAVVGGYLLGRFKKGKLAMRLATQLSGQTPGQMLLEGGKQGADKVMSNDQAKQIVEQLRGPLLEAIQGVVLGRIQGSVTGLSDKLNSKTQELQGKAIDTTADTAGKATDTVKGAADTLTGAVTPRSDDTEGDEQADKGLDKPKQEQLPESETQPADEQSGEQAEAEPEGKKAKASNG